MILFAFFLGALIGALIVSLSATGHWEDGYLAGWVDACKASILRDVRNLDRLEGQRQAARRGLQ